jgi:hypothetical protein
LNDRVQLGGDIERLETTQEEAKMVVIVYLSDQASDSLLEEIFAIEIDQQIEVNLVHPTLHEGLLPPPVLQKI